MGKRSNFINIQLKHHVPSEFSETSRVRTGYELVLAHRTSETYACVAQHDGVVVAIDSALGLIKVRYNQTPPPDLDLEVVAHVLGSIKQSIIPSFVKVAEHELAANRPIYILQAADAKQSLVLNQLYRFKAHLLRVSDVIALPNGEALPMPAYIPETILATLDKTKTLVATKLIPVAHNPADDLDIFKFGTKFTSVSGSFLQQTTVVNVTVGEAIQRGDVIAYNSGFFEPDPLNPKQVTWKHGVMARIALMEGNDTIEDSNAITASFSKRMLMRPAHMRTLDITANTVISDLKPVGTLVQTTDLLCTLEDADIGALTHGDDRSMLDLLTDLNRKAPRAKYHGTIAEIDVLYSCPITTMHPSLAAVVTAINAHKQALADAAAHTHKNTSYAAPGQIAPGTKFHGVEFGTDTVVLIIYIAEAIEHGAGDKLVVGNAAKSVTAAVIENDIATESGYPVDMLFSARSVSNRIILSPTIVGMANRVLEALEHAAVACYSD